MQYRIQFVTQRNHKYWCMECLNELMQNICNEVEKQMPGDIVVFRWINPEFDLALVNSDDIFMLLTNDYNHKSFYTKYYSDHIVLDESNSSVEEATKDALNILLKKKDSNKFTYC